MILDDSPRRLGVFFFFDADGVVDRYVEVLLEDLLHSLSELIVVVNGHLSAKGYARLGTLTPHIIVRENTGLDVWAYKTAMDSYGWDRLAEFDEVVLLNSTIMGPVYPFAEMFDEMAGRDLDFWGPTWFHEIRDSNYGSSSYGYIPRHLQSHFHVYRRSLVTSEAFQSYWDEMPEIEDYVTSVGYHEIAFTKRFEDLGFTSGAYVDTQDLESITNQPVIFAPKRLIADKRCPIFKRRSFFHNYEDVLDQTVGNAALDLYEYLRDETDYDTDLIWENLLRTVELADLVRNLQLTYVLPTRSVDVEPAGTQRIALVMHVHYMELLDQLLGYAASMPADADLIITVGSQDKKRQAEEMTTGLGRRVIVHLVENRGRDVAALLVGARDLVVGYDLVCFIHDKKVTQIQPGTVGEGFALKCYENVLPTKDFVSNVIATFEREPRLGLLTPPPPNHADYFPIYSYAWGPNLERTQRLLKDLGARVPVSGEREVIAPLGSTFWFRPAAVRKIFDFGWDWEDFPPEPLAEDGTVSHAIERAYCYVAQDAGYFSGMLLSDRFARIELTNLSFYTRELTTAMATHWKADREREMVFTARTAGSVRDVVKRRLAQAVPTVLRPAAKLAWRAARRTRRMIR
ncbi:MULTISPECIES: rhamnan synthesis F family protein [Actinomyces]|uniref:Rhamnan synthesis F family protein n=1 Tax=Actinomyces respiraculi TaxID=2744574 RepID=A0A7T0LL67_9ACTO|nr:MULTISPECIES: rhamnan synthesis F family protein [Actinomyces]QPL05819.1 rhamnan synthesis F family protein [Actinomyces respiraculi]